MVSRERAGGASGWDRVSPWLMAAVCPVLAGEAEEGAEVRGHEAHDQPPGRAPVSAAAAGPGPARAPGRPRVPLERGGRRSRPLRRP